MAKPSRYRKGRGPREIATTVIADDGSSNATLLQGIDDYVKVVHRIYFEEANDVDAADWSITINGVEEDGSARTSFRVDDSGDNGITELKYAWDWENPNPITNTYSGYREYSMVALDGTSDEINFVAHDDPAYSSNSVGVTLKINVEYEKVPRKRFYQNTGY